jgi:hypothetical protein
MSLGLADAANILFANAQGPDPSSEVLSVLKAYEGADKRDGFELQLAVLEHWKKMGDTGGLQGGIDFARRARLTRSGLPTIRLYLIKSPHPIRRCH